MIESHGLTVATAEVLGVSRPALSTFLNRSDLSGNMALQIEKALRVWMGTLMRTQASYDIASIQWREGVNRTSSPIIQRPILGRRSPVGSRDARPNGLTT